MRPFFSEICSVRWCHSNFLEDVDQCLAGISLRHDSPVPVANCAALRSGGHGSARKCPPEPARCLVRVGEIRHEGSHRKGYLLPPRRREGIVVGSKTASDLCWNAGILQGLTCRRADKRRALYFLKKLYRSHCDVFAAVVSILALHLSAFCVGYFRPALYCRRADYACLPGKRKPSF
jgi:hypothetical protein